MDSDEPPQMGLVVMVPAARRGRSFLAQFTATTKAATAPNIEPGVYDATFAGVDSKRIKGGQYVKDEVNGDPKLEWNFKLLDDDGKVVRNDNEESDDYGKPVIVSKLTSTSFNIASKTTPGAVKMLKAILTAGEFAAFENGEGTPDSEEDASNGGLLGRKVQVEVFINDAGWPGVGNVLAPRKPRKAAPVKAAADDEEDQ